MVLAPDLEEVKEVRTGSMDADEVFVGLWLWCWFSADLQVFRSGDVLGNLDGAHRAERLLTVWGIGQVYGQIWDG